MDTKSLFLSILSVVSLFCAAQSNCTLQSPEGNITVCINIDNDITYNVRHGNTQVITDTPIYMELSDGMILGHDVKIKNVKTHKEDNIIKADFYKKAEVRDCYNELTINTKDNYKIIFRAYDDGVAYRFSTDFRKPFKIKKEDVTFNFSDNHTVYMPFVNARESDEDMITRQFFNSFENEYTVAKIKELDSNKLAFMPVMVCLEDGKKVVITEADLESYPGTYLRKGEGCSLTGIQAPYPKKERQGGHNMLQYIVEEGEDYIAGVEGKRDFPWRCMIISTEDKELADSDMVYKLASPSRLEDISWIKPGKVAWEWWNAWNIKGVPFEAGINNDTYKIYIDFASEYGIEYVILDEGWAVNKQADLFQVVPEIDLEELIRYGKECNVGIVLWAGYAAIDRDMEEVCRHYSNMGIKGFKVDFMDRDDQKVVDFYYRMAETAARYHLFVDFHGAYKPTGLSRTYPNVLNYEGVFGLEQTKWGEDIDMVTYETTIPYIRMVAGAMDFTQGAMRNATKSNYKAIYNEPMSQGTRCRQLAEYVIFESPFNMLCDTPDNYRDNEECARLIATIPTTWDETVVLDGKVGEYTVIARRKGNRWYIGGITDWNERTLTLDLTPLNLDNDKGVIFRDGINASRNATDYVKENIIVEENTIRLYMASGGGFVIIL